MIKKSGKLNRTQLQLIGISKENLDSGNTQEFPGEGYTPLTEVFSDIPKDWSETEWHCAEYQTEVGNFWMANDRPIIMDAQFYVLEIVAGDGQYYIFQDPECAYLWDANSDVIISYPDKGPHEDTVLFEDHKGNVYLLKRGAWVLKT